MTKEWEIWTPQASIVLWRILGLFLLCMLWLRDHDSEIGVVLLLFLMMMAVARWRFSLSGWMVIIDQAACLVTIPFWSYAAFGLAMPLFEGMLIGKLWFLVPGLIWMFIYFQMSIPLIAVLAVAVLSGWTIRSWSLETNIYRQEADQQRRDRYELESLKGELLLANVQTARMAELAERNRIAQELHDDVGHELTAAVLALQAFEQLWKEENPLARDMFVQAQQRLSNSALYLRERVHNMKPVMMIGLEGLKAICNGFTMCPIHFQSYGDTSSVPAYLWSILEPCLKEALTNAARHAKATKVNISLDVNPHIVRLSIHDDGIGGSGDSDGIGIRNLRQRAKAVGGSISIDTDEGFQLICVLPMEKRSLKA
ncbi:integral membrane sensor signal transduction histidine kinase [Clostridium aceticum]|uniref:histidine kinase n=1 Tax=Clostridium aceticum TaxID=84022 RepID=A0A0D8I9W3_9CLOT|nr:histidine kinase [Clostridium aceticum]AKL95963.1 integral membrane sensor signal transduction histidine kinase [Clostridium aceticum]KJF27090.1 histidine kinase [Clostridium aceticum]